MTSAVTDRTRRVIFFLACVGCAVPLATAADPPKPAFAVSSFDVGAVDQLRAKDAELANELNAQEWCTARPQAKTKAWNEVPAGVEPNEWVSVVTVGFGKQAEAYAFQFSAQGNARLLAHVSHRKVPIRGIEQWTSPFGKLASALRVGYAAPRPPALPALQLDIVQAAAIKPKSTTTPDEPLTLPPEKVLPPLRVIITAAACEAGWAPTPQPATVKARVEVRVLDQACAFRVTFTQDGRDTIVVRDRVPWEEFHDQLTAVFRQAAPGSKVVDFARPATGRVELLGVEKDRIVCVADDELTGLDAATGAEAWRLRIPQPKVGAKKVEGYTARRDADGTVRVFRWTTALAEVAPADGKLRVLALVAAASPSSFDVAANGDVIMVRGARVTCYARGQSTWSATEAHPITCGPRVDAEQVLVGTEHGDLIAFARAGGRELWRAAPGKRLTGPITTAGALRLVFCADDETLAAIDPTNGAMKWRFAAGDTLVQPPFEYDGAVIVVTKQNRIARLNPTTGAVVAEVRWPTWVVAVQPLAVGGQTRLAAGDVSGKLALLGPDLKPTWESALGARVTGRAAFAKVPAFWKGAARPAKGGDDLIEAIAADAAGTKPFVLATDANGFLYKLSAEGIK